MMQKIHLSGCKVGPFLCILSDTMGHICSHEHAPMLDNIFRVMIHNPIKMFGKYVKPGMRVIDLGCGAGFTSLGLAKLVGETGRVVAVDLQQEMLDILSKRAEKQKLIDRITLHKCGENAIGAEGPFDFANAFYMVHETPDSTAFLKEVHSILKPGALFYIAEPPFHVTGENFDKMLTACGDIGFSVFERPRVVMSRVVVLTRN